ncbi:DeoR/GlpR family DNA-binding transcription regulator [uncultured Jannaschia sp.]|uniref:DeoR/GlpR family DNA-binding transcription regulator n=1 Tax=uncultured Jannaschia sp. TaxID=293347 RepID=UPI002623D473|nr:DeoR/GlpR family DNA-binding transcription regulator [uncultured Jannaschia sp.]
MAQIFRHPEIIDIARREGRVTVDGLAAHFGVTLQTIRRDLTDLAEAGRLERVHGGAILPSGTANVIYEQRRSQHRDAKTAIGRACAAVLPGGASVFLGIGTTTEAVASAIVGHENMIAVTNNINVAQILIENPECEVVLCGGTVRPADGGMVGPLTESTIGQFKFDYAVIGCSAVEADGDILDFDQREVSVTRAAMARARQTILVADHGKFQRKAPIRVGSLGDIDLLVTDRRPGDALAASCADWGTRVVVTPVATSVATA